MGSEISRKYLLRNGPLSRCCFLICLQATGMLDQGCELVVTIPLSYYVREVQHHKETVK